MTEKSNKIRLIFVIYWFLLAYVVAALIWWFIALSRQNSQMTDYKIERIQANSADYNSQYHKIIDEKNRKEYQYLGEGAIFLLLIIAGAIFLYKAVNKQLKISRQQQNFMIAVTHELKTPIAITKLNLETLEKRKLDDDQQRRLINNTLDEANRMNTLCNNLLLSSQFDAGGYKITKEPVLLNELIENSFNDFKKRHPGRNFVNTINENIHIVADSLLMQMVINNLLDNAIKYSPKEGKITAAVQKNEKTYIVSISDEGNGINHTERNKVFEKFYRSGSDANKKAKGTGLGLYLSQKIISAHGGKISIDDNQPKGSIFMLELNKTV
ncbi:MAG: GHKL domain-containing protein [Ferruginibacter sp.]|nr:GHKL domain-containing protein [Ferruginibacter sp.]